MPKFLLFLLIIPNLVFAEEKKPELGPKHESALGYVTTGGNSVSETFNFKQDTSYAWIADKLKWSGNYINTKARNAAGGPIEATAENWATTLRYDRVLSDRFNSYAQTGLSADRFQGSREKKSAGVGGKYYTIKNKYFEWSKELGYEYSRELFTQRPNANTTIHPEFHFIRVYTQADYAFEKNLKFGLFVEYLYPFADQREPATLSDEEVTDYRVNFSPYMTSILSDMFSIKVSYEGKYRNDPVVAGNAYLDFTFTTALLAAY